jgi:hypothetical protein
MSNAESVADRVSIVAEVVNSSRKKTGRTPDPIRSEFDPIDSTDTGSTAAVRCKHCSTVISDARKLHLERHIQRCEDAPSSAKKYAIDRAAGKAGSDSSLPRSRSGKRSAESSLMQPGMGSFVFRTQNVTDKAKDDQHNAELCKWLVSSGIAFNTVDDPFFVQYIGGLSPGHKVAGARQSAGLQA